MSKNTTPAKSTTSTRDALTAELELIRRGREAEEKAFRAALEKLYADHRTTMKSLSERRAKAWATYASERKEKPEAEAPAKKPATKKAAKKAAKKMPAKTDAELTNS